jgi:hypothetical protein
MGGTRLGARVEENEANNSVFHRRFDVSTMTDS